MDKLRGPSLQRLFERISSGGDILPDDVARYLDGLGVGGGFFGGTKIQKGVDAFMRKFDTEPCDGRVTWQEFVKNGRHLLPPGLINGKGELDASLVDDVFQAIAGKTERASAQHVASYVAPRVTGSAAFFADTIADAAGKLAVDALDTDGDDAFTKNDLNALLDDINTLLTKS